MYSTNRRFSIWYMLGPAVIYFMVQIGVQLVVNFSYVSLNKERLLAVADNTEATLKVVAEMTMELFQYATQMTAVAALIMLPIGMIMFRKDRRWEELNGVQAPQKASLDKYVLILILGVALCIGLNNLITLSSVASLSPTYQSVSKLLYSPGFVTQIVCLGIIAPITEELIYRGLVYRRLTMIFTTRRALLLSSCLFGLIHANLVQFIYATITGLIMGFLYERYGSLKAPIFAHMVMNLTSVIGTQINLFEWIFYSPMRMGLVTILCAAAASTMYVLVQRKILQKC